jgi:hypothetical protein
MPDETFNDQTRASVQVLQYLGPLPTKLSRTVHLDYAPQQIDFNPNKVYMASQFTAIRRDLFYIKPSRIAKLAEFSRKMPLEAPPNHSSASAPEETAVPAACCSLRRPFWTRKNGSIMFPYFLPFPPFLCVSSYSSILTPLVHPKSVLL